MSSKTDDINDQTVRLSSAPSQCPSQQSVCLMQYQPAAIWSAAPR